ncbi:MAG: Rpp14/Pop5 family protein [Candidatus Micrarchaeia archaeon]
MIMKKKSRYVLVMSSKPINMSRQYLLFANALSRQIGKIGIAELDLSLAKSLDDNLFIFKMARGKEGVFILGISFIKKLQEEENIGFYSLLVSGTIKSLLARYSRKLG